MTENQVTEIGGIFYTPSTNNSVSAKYDCAENAVAESETTQLMDRTKLALGVFTTDSSGKITDVVAIVSEDTVTALDSKYFADTTLKKGVGNEYTTGADGVDTLRLDSTSGPIVNIDSKAVVYVKGSTGGVYSKFETIEDLDHKGTVLLFKVNSTSKGYDLILCR